MPKVTRREFTAGLAGAAAGLAAARAHGEEKKIRPSVFGGILVGVQSYTFRKFDLDRMITAMRSVGLSNVELWDGHLDPAKATGLLLTGLMVLLSAASIAYSVPFSRSSGW